MVHNFGTIAKDVGHLAKCFQQITIFLNREVVLYCSSCSETELHQLIETYSLHYKYTCTLQYKPRIKLK